MSERRPKILVLSSADLQDRIELNDLFVGELAKRIGSRASIEWHNYHNLRFEFASDELSVYLITQNKKLEDFDFVYIKSYFRYSELAGVVATYLENKKVRFVCSELKNHIPLTKLTQLSRMAVSNIPIGQTVFVLADKFAESYDLIEQKLGLPFVFKAIDGSGGDENFLVRAKSDMVAALEQFPNLQFIAQKFIANDSDYRVLVVGSQIKLIIKRQRKSADTHLNNTSQGADAKLVDLDEMSEEYKSLSLKAAKIMDREIAGVDLLFEFGSGKPYILEVNASPQIASGAFTEEKLQIYTDYFLNMIEPEGN